MLIELAVRDLGVIADARVPFESGMTALTGETGAGKTMLVEALHLLSGGRADPTRVRTGAAEAVVEGLFAVGETEWVLRRVVPARGRSRCYLNGELSTAARLEEIAATLLEIHGQHSQQALLSPRHQRDALDRFAGVDRAPLDHARRRVRRLTEELEGLGGDERTRRRQMDLLAHQVGEIDASALRPGEDESLEAEEDLLAGAVEYRQAAEQAVDLLAAEGGAADILARARGAIAAGVPFGTVEARLAALALELSDCASDLRTAGDAIEPDEQRLAEVRARRQLLVELRRKYGETTEEILAFAEGARAELAGLDALDGRRAELHDLIQGARTELTDACRTVGRQRRAAAAVLAAAVQEVLADLALGGATVELTVADTEDLPDAGEHVEIRLATGPGVVPGPLGRVASGGELSRVMLALRLVLSGGPPTMVFDEVDAGVGGQAATAVGAALARLGEQHQVLVVTHLAQVAAAGANQVVVDKQVVDAAARTAVRPVEGEDRVVEISRMLSGSPDSTTARKHANELLSLPGPVR